MSLAELETLSQNLVSDVKLPVRFSVAQFDAMIEAGVFSSQLGARVQLLRGEILTMAPPNPLHDDVITLLTGWASDCFQAKRAFEMRVQLSMDLVNQNSVVLPDLMLATSKSYSKQRPTAADALLLIEVSDSSLSLDLGEKMKLYAEAGVKEYWVIDIPHRCLVVHLDPADGRYRSVQTFDEQTSVTASALPSVSLIISQLFR